MSLAGRGRRNQAAAPAVDATQLLPAWTTSAFTRRHGLIYSIVIAGHLCDGFDVSLTGYNIA